MTILKAALNYALSEQRIKHGEAWQRVKPFRGTTSARLRFLSDEEQLRLVNTCPNGFRELVQGALLTGCRYGELARLQVRDYNANAGTVFIAESKSGKSRHVFLTEEGKTLFEAQTAGRPAECFIFEQERKRRKRLNLGKHWGHGDASKIMKDVCKLAEIESLTFHELRHTYASKLVNKGVPLAYVAAQLGHSTTRMVEKHYGHLAPSAMAEAIRAALPSLGLVQKSKIQTLKVSGNKE